MKNRAVARDARRVAEQVVRFTHGKTFADFLADDLLRSGVERQLAIVGEAFNQLRQIDPATAAPFPTCPVLLDSANVLVHAYATVDHRIVWGIIETNVVPVLAALDALIGQP